MNELATKATLQAAEIEQFRTLVDILLGLLSPDSGEVRVDGRDIQENLRNWQDQIGYVPQSIFLTDDTLRRNVAFGLSDEQIDASAVQRAIGDAQLEEFVDSLPDGQETIVGERGVRLSGGQRQRISIARAILRDPRILILDEATSSIDTITEARLQESMETLLAGRTSIVVAHRLSTIRSADLILVLDHGRIVERGSAIEVFANPQHPYTEALLSAVPIPDPTIKRKKIILQGDVPSPIKPPSGCHFHTRCPYAEARCRVEVPTLKEIAPGHQVSCHLR